MKCLHARVLECSEAHAGFYKKLTTLYVILVLLDIARLV